MAWHPALIPLQAISAIPRPLPTWELLQGRSAHCPLESGLYLVNDVPESGADIIFVSDIYSPLVLTSNRHIFGYTLGQAFTSFGFRRDGFWLQRDIAPRVGRCRVLVYNFSPMLQFQPREEAYKLLLELSYLYPEVSSMQLTYLPLVVAKIYCIRGAWTRWSYSHGRLAIQVVI
jgi:hypothetical protein